MRLFLLQDLSNVLSLWVFGMFDLYSMDWELTISIATGIQFAKNGRFRVRKREEQWGSCAILFRIQRGNRIQSLLTHNLSLVQCIGQLLFGLSTSNCCHDRDFVFSNPSTLSYTSSFQSLILSKWNFCHDIIFKFTQGQRILFGGTRSGLGGEEVGPSDSEFKPSSFLTISSHKSEQHLLLCCQTL